MHSNRPKLSQKLAIVAKEKESIRRTLEVTAKEKESARRKLVVTAEELKKLYGTLERYYDDIKGAEIHSDSP